MPVQTMPCPQCQGKGYCVVRMKLPKNQTTLKRLSCSRCGGLGVILDEIPSFVPEGLRKLMNV